MPLGSDLSYLMKRGEALVLTNDRFEILWIRWRKFAGRKGYMEYTYSLRVLLRKDRLGRKTFMTSWYDFISCVQCKGVRSDLSTFLSRG